MFLTGKHSKMTKVRYDPSDLSVPAMARADPEFLELAVETSPSPSGPWERCSSKSYPPFAF